MPWEGLFCSSFTLFLSSSKKLLENYRPFTFKVFYPVDLTWPVLPPGRIWSLTSYCLGINK